jgi:hypothetical protein
MRGLLAEAISQRIAAKAEDGRCILLDLEKAERR